MAYGTLCNIFCAIYNQVCCVAVPDLLSSDQLEFCCSGFCVCVFVLVAFFI